MAKSVYDVSTNLSSHYTDLKAREVDRVEFRTVREAYPNLSIFKLIISIFVCIALFRVLSNLEMFTFEGLLQSLSELPRINFTFTNVIDLTISGDWGIFEFLRNVINGSVTIINLLLWLASLLLQGVRWLYNFILLLLY